MATNMLTLDSYLSADKATKARIRADIKAATDAAVRSGDFSRASELVAVSDAIKAHAATASASTFDVTVAASDLAATYEAAAAWLRHNGATAPGTVIEKTFDRMAKLPSRKSGRGNVIEWIESVVDDDAATIATLRGRWVATSDYPDAPPSAGAIGAAFDRVEAGAEADFTVTTVNGKRGAVA